jgi:anti-anti-sigma factor
MRNIERLPLEPRQPDPVLEPFRLEVRPDRQRVFVAPCGELDLATVDQLRTQIDDLVERGFGAIVVDLRETSFMDSSALHLLIDESARNDACVSIIDGRKPVSRLFDLAGVRSLLRFEVSP